MTRGAGSLGLDPARTKNPQVIVIADTISLYPREFYEKGLRIVTAATQRTQSAALSPRIKSLNYLNSRMLSTAISISTAARSGPCLSRQVEI